MTEQNRIEVLERQVKVLSTFVHAMMSQSPVAFYPHSYQLHDPDGDGR